MIRVAGHGLVLKPKPKTKAGWRTLVLPTWCVHMLHTRHEQVREGGGGASASPMVFPSPKGKLRDPKNTNRDLRRVYDTAGLPQITSHTFRRSVATAMDHAGLTARMAADQLGHQKISMTTDTYYARQGFEEGGSDRNHAEPV